MNVTFTLLEIGLLALIVIFIIFIIAYRRFPVHLIYKSKIGFESMLDAIDEPLAVISEDFTVKRVNKAYTELIGRSYKTSINSKCYHMLRGRSSPCEDCKLKQALSESQRQEVEISPHPRGDDGSVNITFSIYAMPIGGNTAEICVIEHIRDITTLEALKMSLERRNTFLATLTEQLRTAQRSIKSELHVARQIQLGLLPSTAPAVSRIRFDMAYQPVADVGGDLYDFIRIDDNRLGVFIGDASGHGLAASLIGTLSKMSLYNHSKAGLSTSQLLEHMDKDLNAHIHTSHYLTCFWCVLDFEKNMMTYSRAGHPKQIILRKDGQIHWLSGSGIFLGITGSSVYEQKEFAFENGDRIFWFTDGIYDVFRKNWGASGESGELLGYDKFAEMVKGTAGLPFEKIIGTLRKGLSGFDHDDDYTLIVAEICDDANK
ncbi:MAG: SpoIIE family protein phosphatase [Chitinispirillia bacterium]|nr:SpoIIE family protein phosphatase [Chitinispirillia bacterium]MCL2241218.1 SpoIIE family protein phosphatase [Chitinispirillia bacterium]